MTHYINDIYLESEKNYILTVCDALKIPVNADFVKGNDEKPISHYEIKIDIPEKFYLSLNAILNNGFRILHGVNGGF